MIRACVLLSARRTHEKRTREDYDLVLFHLYHNSMYDRIATAHFMFLLKNLYTLILAVSENS